MPFYRIYNVHMRKIIDSSVQFLFLSLTLSRSSGFRLPLLGQTRVPEPAEPPPSSSWVSPCACATPEPAVQGGTTQLNTNIRWNFICQKLSVSIRNIRLYRTLSKISATNIPVESCLLCCSASYYINSCWWFTVQPSRWRYYRC